MIRLGLVSLLCVVWLLSACNDSGHGTPPTSTPAVAPTVPTPAPSVDAVEVQRVLAAFESWLGIPAGSLRIADARARLWPDSCMDMHPAQREYSICQAGRYSGIDVLIQDRSGARYRVQAIPRQLPQRIAAATASGQVVQGDLDSLILRDESGDHGYSTRGGTLLSNEPHGERVIGREVVIGYDPGGSLADSPLVVWIALRR